MGATEHSGQLEPHRILPRESDLRAHRDHHDHNLHHYLAQSSTDGLFRDGTRRRKRGLRIHLYRMVTAIVITIIVMPSIGSAGSPRSTGKVMFITCTMNHDESVVLKRVRIVPGSIKNKKRGDGDILYEVTGNGDTPVIRGTLHSPLIRYFDYPDPENPSVLKGGRIIDTTAEFVVRIPYEKRCAIISFFKKADDDATELHKRSETQGFPKGKSLGSFAIPEQEGGR